jgi:hypothetical protein
LTIYSGVVEKNPGMWVRSPSRLTAAAFLTGVNAGLGGSLLEGFEDWLVDQAGTGPNNLAWPWLLDDQPQIVEKLCGGLNYSNSDLDQARVVIQIARQFLRRSSSAESPE